MIVTGVMTGAASMVNESTAAEASASCVNVQVYSPAERASSVAKDHVPSVFAMTNEPTSVPAASVSVESAHGVSFDAA